MNIRNIMRIVLFTGLVISIVTIDFTYADEKPKMPFSANNIKTFKDRVDRAEDNIDISQGTEVDKQILVFKKPMEKMGYSFDKTFRYVIKTVFIDKNAEIKFPNIPEMYGFLRMISVAREEINKHPDEALRKSLISKETYNVVKMAIKLGEAEEFHSKAENANSEGKYNDVVEYLSRAIALNSKDAEAYLARSNALICLGQYDQAITDCETAMKVGKDETKMSVYYNLARIYSMKNDATNACQYLKQDIKIGYSDWEQIKTNNAFDNIRASECYQNIMKDK